MDNKKFEQLIDLIINENEEQARVLFHDIVIEKSREIYESMMYDEEVEENMEMSGGQDQVDGLMNEIGVEEEGMTEEEDEMSDFDDIDSGDADSEMMSGEVSSDPEAPATKGDVMDLEDKLEDLLAAFEQKLGSSEEEEIPTDDADMSDMSDMAAPDAEDGEEVAADDEESLAEAVQLKKVSVTHGDNGQNTKSPVSGGPKVSGNGASAVKTSTTSETGGKVKAPSEIPGKYKNAAGGSNFSEKGESAPKAKQGDDGQNTKSPLGESKKSVKKIVK